MRGNEADMEHSFLGTGIKFPIQVNEVTGEFVMSSEEESVKESVYIILMTQKGERWLRPAFGSSILSYVFTDISLTRISMMEKEIARTIIDNEPRISQADVDIQPAMDQGCLIINLQYTIARTNRKDNLVFPFYFEQ